jgi:3-methyladenine DNA glycosylase AlkC
VAELLKNIYNENFFDQYTLALSKVLPGFDQFSFLSQVKTNAWGDMELKQRMHHLMEQTGKILPKSFKSKVEIISQMINVLSGQGVKSQNLEYIFLADLITEFGLEELKDAITAFEIVTKFTSCEFAVRKFIINYPDQMMQQMLKWSLHENENVRRFASEGCRPLLPWGLRLQSLVKDPSVVIPVLQNLKDDPSLYVRKSVANHLNDISKNQPKLVLDIFKSWQKDGSEYTNWIVKHGARTLLKQGNSQALALFGTSSETPFSLVTWEINKNEVALGGEIHLSFSLKNNYIQSATFRIEYVIYFVKSNGTLSKKIFKISEKRMFAEETITISKKHKFIDLTTRRHYAGVHKVGIVINGNESELKEVFLSFDKSNKTDPHKN